MRAGSAASDRSPAQTTTVVPSARSASAAIDWFSVFFFSACALVIWVIYVAMQTGVPAKPAANVAKLAPGFVPVFSAFALVAAAFALLAAGLSLAWYGRVA